MKYRKIETLISLVVIITSVIYSFWVLMPKMIIPQSASKTKFSAERAAYHLKEISKDKHPSGSPEVLLVRDYLIGQLESLGLKVEIQSGEVNDRWGGNRINIHNILTRIEGSKQGKALLVLAHYDSTPNSYGAADDGSGIVTILEWVRAYLASGKQSINDIIILFTDAEEQGMLGAKLFTASHAWAKDVGFALNFEARGSGGPGFTLVETNRGNANMIELYKEANLKYPLATSLFYSLYKLLPNDGDSRILRERLDIDGFLFAFIDDHFDYHRPTDTYENMDLNSIQHQGSYLMPLVAVFANTNLSNIKTNENVVFFNFPLLGLVSYSYKLIFPLTIVTIIFFLALVIYGFRINRLSMKMIGRGAVLFLLLIVACGVIGFFGGNKIPDLASANRFPENGHIYILFFVFLCLSFLLQISHRFSKREHEGVNFIIAPIFFWIILNTVIAYYLKGANYFIIPVLFSLISLLIALKSNKSPLLIHTLLSIPMIVILAPMIKFFPLALGPRLMVSSTLILALILGLMQIIIGQLKFRNAISLMFLLLAVGTYSLALSMK